MLDQIRGQRGKSIDMVVRPAAIDRHVPAFGVAGFAQALPEGSDTDGIGLWSPLAQVTDHRDCRLRARRERPCRDHAADKCDELTPCHSALVSSEQRTCRGDYRLSALTA